MSTASNDEYIESVEDVLAGVHLRQTLPADRPAGAKRVIAAGIQYD
jgi:hypothetical protein